MEQCMNETHTQLPAAETASPTALDHDMTLEYDSMVLLSKLEQCVIRLGDKMVQTSTSLALEYLLELTNAIVEFFEQSATPTMRKLPLEALLTKDQQNYALLRPQLVSNNRLVLQTLTDQGTLKQPNMFPKLSNDLLRVVNIYLSLNVKAFQTPRMVEQWRTIYAGFLKHLVKALRDIQVSQ
jgi:hypothetical protein